jgi:hypothetical protein
MVLEIIILQIPKREDLFLGRERRKTQKQWEKQWVEKQRGRFCLQLLKGKSKGDGSVCNSCVPLFASIRGFCLQLLLAI